MGIVSTSTGNAGEYFVAGELERRGYTVAVPMSGVENFDILAIDRQSLGQIAVQVKTTTGSKRRWMMSAKAESLAAGNAFYVFVALNGLEAPEYHIVPSAVVAQSVRAAHRAWLDTPGRNGQPHKDNSARVFELHDESYKSRWDLLRP